MIEIILGEVLDGLFEKAKIIGRKNCSRFDGFWHGFAPDQN
jgi:hypothetical protein